ncbi:MAG TPA: hypothetical protein VGJ93_07225 [Desulfuromonadaceae bacterium]|jgi:hypothetical protein
MRLAAIIFILSSFILAENSFCEAKTVRVKGKMRKNGTYVQPHYKSSPDKSRYNNYDTKGNINPYTGKKGTEDPVKPK